MNNLKKLFGHRLRQLRKNRNLTQEQLAEKLDISLPNISYIENGKTYPSVETQEKLCKVLNVKYVDLYMFDKTPSEEEMKEEILQALNNNPKLLKIFYKIYKFCILDTL